MPFLRPLAVLAVALLGVSAPIQNSMDFAGRWERVAHRNDGRFGGGSARSFHPGDALNIVLTGTGFLLYGITGPTGGRAIVLVPREPEQTIDFYSPVKRTHVLLYRTPPLPPGPHVAAVVVAPQRDPRSRGNYVNIDAVTILNH